VCSSDLRRRPVGLFRARLILVDIEPSPDAMAHNRLAQCGLVDDCPARRVDQQRALGQRCKKLRVDHVVGLGCRGNMERNRVALPRKIQQRCPIAPAIAHTQLGSTIGRHVPRPRDDVHLTPDGWDYNSGCWPCDDESQALESLTTIKGMIDTHIEPRFQSKTTLSSLADEMNADRRGIEMATLYRAEGDIERARQALMQYRERLEKPQSWADPKRVAADIKRVDSLLQEIR